MCHTSFRFSIAHTFCTVSRDQVVQLLYLYYLKVERRVRALHLLPSNPSHFSDGRETRLAFSPYMIYHLWSCVPDIKAVEKPKVNSEQRETTIGYRQNVPGKDSVESGSARLLRDITFEFL